MSGGVSGRIVHSRDRQTRNGWHRLQSPVKKKKKNTHVESRRACKVSSASTRVEDTREAHSFKHLCCILLSFPSFRLSFSLNCLRVPRNATASSPENTALWNAQKKRQMSVAHPSFLLSHNVWWWVLWWALVATDFWGCLARCESSLKWKHGDEPLMKCLWPVTDRQLKT